ncbi:cupin-like domain-containing protein [Zavarzinella formosa]|uniref:cupin-like domain-containing protein n=1 Tax=Zavarzinella formosa TaxID=360055 RepID=UPI0002EAB119|nr:cupin-like domain-containing protein [Zavarzinella formosa]
MTYQGPSFQFVEEIQWEELSKSGGFGPRTSPLLIKGAVRAWPAWDNWSFDKLADLKRKDGSEVSATFQDGLVEQGVTREPPRLAISPYLRQLGRQAENSVSRGGLLPVERLESLGRDATFHLDWSHMQSFEPNKLYLAQWNILDEFPELRKDFAIRSLWPGWRWTWEFVFMGPANTVTGLHYDFPNNWFCQVRGTKEVILFPPDQSPHLCRSSKYDWGATLSDINISRLGEQPDKRESFAKARGLYACVEAGDALFIPRQNWHAVVSREPSISLAVFGLTPAEIILNGGRSEFKQLLHRAGLYRKNNCTCHKMTPAAKNVV